jgi:vacuolar-type H+-ATPase subunit D/Vma8
MSTPRTLEQSELEIIKLRMRLTEMENKVNCIDRTKRYRDLERKRKELVVANFELTREAMNWQAEAEKYREMVESMLYRPGDNSAKQAR